MNPSKCESLSFELPKDNAVWNRDLTVRTLEKDQFAIPKMFTFVKHSTSRKLGSPLVRFCNSDQHMRGFVEA